jgi:dTDP-4-amino-4,6-dideoxygalactose transaminase
VKYHNDVIGYNCRLDEIQAAFLRVKLSHVDMENARRREIADFYTREFSGWPSLQLPLVPTETEPAWHLYVVRHGARDALGRHLADDGIDTLLHYPVPPHLQPAYADLGIPRGLLPIAERMHDEVISLPIGGTMPLEHASRVVASIERWLQRHDGA